MVKYFKNFFIFLKEQYFGRIVLDKRKVQYFGSGYILHIKVVLPCFPFIVQKQCAGSIVGIKRDSRFKIRQFLQNYEI